jgi:hypothetical protein
LKDRREPKSCSSPLRVESSTSGSTNTSSPAASSGSPNFQGCEVPLARFRVDPPRFRRRISISNFRPAIPLTNVNRCEVRFLDRQTSNDVRARLTAQNASRFFHKHIQPLQGIPGCVAFASLHEISIDLTERFPNIISAAHLYNTSQQFTGLGVVEPEMEAFIEAQTVEHHISWRTAQDSP